MEVALLSTAWPAESVDLAVGLLVVMDDASLTPNSPATADVFGDAVGVFAGGDEAQFRLQALSRRTITGIPVGWNGRCISRHHFDHWFRRHPADARVEIGAGHNWPTAIDESNEEEGWLTTVRGEGDFK